MGTVGLVLTGLVMAVGLVGTVVPVLPGLAVIWAAALVYGLLAGFATAGTVAFTAMTGLAVLGTVAAVVLPHRGGAVRGAARSSLVAGVAGAVVGAVVIPVLGLPIGGVIGVWLAETSRLGDARQAWRITTGVVIGFGLGALAEFGVGVAMIGCWVAWVLLGP